MPQISLIGGPFDGTAVTFRERMPDRLELSRDCTAIDFDDPEQANLFAINSFAEPTLTQQPMSRHLRSLTEIYELDQDDDAQMFYRYLGWKADVSAVGVRP